jgi:Flp pilus assembly protein TadD
MYRLFSMLFERFGINAYIRGDLAKAERWFRRVEATEPDSLSVLRNLGVLLLAKGDAEGAERYLLREEKLYGKSFHRHAGLADLAYARGKRKEAERRYALALAEPECSPGGVAESSRVLMEKRYIISKDERLYASSRQALKAFEEAQALREAKDFRASIERFLDSIALDETNWSALNNAGSIYLNNLGEPEKAKELFERALEISRNPQVIGNLELAAKRARKSKRG